MASGLPQNLQIEIAPFADHAAAIQAVRRQVFLLEQGIPPELEIDGLDATAQHLLAYLGDQPVGTTRIRLLEAGAIAKIERVAVLAPYRRQGIGRALVAAVLSYLQQLGVLTALLHAQLSTQGFYEDLGFIPQGEPFMEAGIAHIKMCQRLTQLKL